MGWFRGLESIVCERSSLPQFGLGALIMADGQQRHQKIEDKGHKASKRLVSRRPFTIRDECLHPGDTSQ